MARPSGSRTVSNDTLLTIRLAVDRIIHSLQCSHLRAFEILADRGFSRIYVGDNSHSSFVDEISERPFLAPIEAPSGGLVGQIQTYRSAKTIAHYYYEAGKILLDRERSDATAEDLCRDIVPLAAYERMLNELVGRPHELAGWAVAWRPPLQLA